MRKRKFIAILILTSFCINILFSCKKTKKNYFDGSSKINLPYKFKSAEAEKLSVEGFDLAKRGYYKSAMKRYLSAIRIESDNPKLYFDLSNCYSETDDLKKAISYLDTAIMIDSNYAPFYGNRGLFFYQNLQVKKAIPDLKRAIQLDPLQHAYYYNLALAYHAIDSQSQACDALEKSERLGLKVERESKSYLDLKEFCELESYMHK